MAESKLYPGEKIIDDSTPDAAFESPDGQMKGYAGMFRSQQSADALTKPFPQELLIPESDWQGWIEEQEERQTRVTDLIHQAGMRTKDQKKTNFCWAFSPVVILQIWRMIQGQAYVSLSPASVACQINGFQNQGGYGEDALRWLIEHGAVPTSLWPDTAIDRKYNTADARAIAESYRVNGWFNLRPRSRQEQVSCVLRRMPYSAGHNWWRHQVSHLEAVWRNGQVGIRFLNQWGENYPTVGAGGYSILQGSKMLADDAVTVNSGTAS